VFAFGLNNHGQLGVGDLDEHDSAERIVNLEQAVKVTGAEHHSIALDAKGKYQFHNFSS
jgi:hypothetical protein